MENKSAWKGKIIFFIVAVFLGFVYYSVANAETDMDIDKKTETEETKSICPLTQITDQKTCQGCHEVQRKDGAFVWGVKDKAWLDDVPFNAKLRYYAEDPYMYFLLEDIDASNVLKAYEYCVKHGIKKVHMEIQSPGGSVVEAWRIIGLMENYKNRYGIVTDTESLGMAASAGFLILASGTGTRTAAPTAMIMCHELWSLSFLKLETPAKALDDAENLRIWQDNLNRWISSHSKVTMDEIAAKIKHRSWWMVGEDAYKWGFVDKLSWGDESLILMIPVVEPDINQ